MKSREATKNQKKTELLATFKFHRQELYKELNVSSERVVDFGKNMALIGGVLYVSYTVLDRFLDAKLKTAKKNNEPNKFEVLNKIILPVLAMGLQQGSIALLKRAKDMLINYLEEKAEKDA